MPNLRSGLKIVATQVRGRKVESTKANTSSSFAIAFLDTVNQSSSIIESTPESSKESVFLSTQPAPLPKLPKAKPTCSPIQVVLVECPVTWLTQLLNDKPEYRDKVAFVSSASSTSPGGLTEELDSIKTPTPEQVLCTSSTLYHTLKAHEPSYPWPKFACPEAGPGSRDHTRINVSSIFSPGVTIFKSGPKDDFALLSAEKRATMVVVSIEPPKDANDDNVDAIIELGHKIVTILRLVGSHGKTVLIFDDLGCDGGSSVGRFKKKKRVKSWNDPSTIAQMVLHITMNDKEFLGRFEEIFLVSKDVDVFEMFRDTILLGELGVNLGIQ